MTAKIIQIAQLQQRYSGSYAFTVTHEPDPDYRSYLSRQLRGLLPPAAPPHPADARPLDISLDDLEGDVVAGVSAVTLRDTLVVDLLWVGEPLRGQGIGRRLMQMVEEEAVKRGCTRARLRTCTGIAFFVGIGYEITGTVQTVPFRKGDAPAQSVCWLAKSLV